MVHGPTSSAGDADVQGRRDFELRAAGIDSTSPGVLVMDRGWQITYANNAWARLAATAPSDMIGRSFWDLFPTLRHTPSGALLQDVAADRYPRRLQAEYADGRVRAMLDIKAAATSTGDVICELRGASTLPRSAVDAGSGADDSADVALLRSAARQLSEATDSESVLRAATAFVQRECGASSAGVAAIQGDRVVVLHFDGPGSMPAGSSYPLAKSLTDEVVRTGTVARERSYDPPDPALRELMRQDGVGEMMLAPLVAYNQTVGVLAASRLLGEPEFTPGDEHRLRLIADHAAVALWKTRLLEQARAANQAKTNFLATMSHELRTPLTALTGYGELLADDILGPMPPQQKDVIERMRAVTHHLTVLIDEVLAFSNLEGGRELVRTADISAEALVYAVSAVARPIAEQKSIDYTGELPDAALQLTTDPDKARQVLVNLVGNAIKFTEQGAVALRVHQQDGEVHFLVSDTGIGIAVGDRARLFQAFGQLDASLTRRHGGTGLGLYISARLASLLGGRIEVESELGVGSTFRLVLPVGGPPPAAEVGVAGSEASFAACVTAPRP